MWDVPRATAVLLKTLLQMSRAMIQIADSCPEPEHYSDLVSHRPYHLGGDLDLARGTESHNGPTLGSGKAGQLLVAE